MVAPSLIGTGSPSAWRAVLVALLVVLFELEGAHTLPVELHTQAEAAKLGR